MKLKVKKFKWLAGRPVVILHDKTARRLNVFQNDRVCLENGHKFYAVVDIFSRLVKEDEIGLSEEVNDAFLAKEGYKLNVHAAEISEAGQIIKKKIAGYELTAKEIEVIIEQIVKNNLTEAEIAYFVAAQKLKGMTMKESIALTAAMVKTGMKLKFNSKNIVDKHCIGGIAGNRTTPIVVSICAAAGLKIPKTSSRAITSAAGTADVIETIANIELTSEEIQSIVKKTNACLVWGGGLRLSPSDDKIIQIERLLNLDIDSQLLASILSKKIAAGSKKILIDIPYGKSGKIKNIKDAKKLGNKFEEISEHFNVKTKVIYTDGKQPIGNGIGPVLEMLDIIKVLKLQEDAPQDLRKKSLNLAEYLLELGGIKEPKKKAIELLDNGKAYEKFKEIINAQNGKNNFDFKIRKLKLDKFTKTFNSGYSGKITSIDNKKIDMACRILGTPELASSGAFLHKHIGPVKKGEKLLTLYASSEDKLQEAIKYLRKNPAITFN